MGESNETAESSDLMINRYPSNEEIIKIKEGVENTTPLFFFLSDYVLKGFGLNTCALSEAIAGGWITLENFLREYVQDKKGKKFLELPLLINDFKKVIGGIGISHGEIIYDEEGLSWYERIKEASSTLYLPKILKDTTKINGARFHISCGSKYSYIPFEMLFERDCFCASGSNELGKKILQAYALNLQPLIHKEK